MIERHYILNVDESTTSLLNIIDAILVDDFGEK